MSCRHLYVDSSRNNLTAPSFPSTNSFYIIAKPMARSGNGLIRYRYFRTSWRRQINWLMVKAKYFTARAQLTPTDPDVNIRQDTYVCQFQMLKTEIVAIRVDIQYSLTVNHVAPHTRNKSDNDRYISKSRSVPDKGIGHHRRL